MSEENKALARRVVEEVWEKKNPGLTSETHAENVSCHVPGEDLKGRESYRNLIHAYTTAFPDCHYTIDEQVAEGDKVSTRYTFMGTHQGELMGIAPTGKEVKVSGVNIMRIEGGKVVDEWMVWDTLEVMVQLGVVPSPSES